MMIAKLLLSLCCLSFILGQNSELVSSLKATESLRSFSARTLGNADDWEIILKYNGFASVDEVKANARLLVPIASYKRLTKKIIETTDLLKKATKLGAALLASKDLDQANLLKRRAVNLKQNGELQKSSNEIQQALSFATKAIKKTEEKRVQAVTAVLHEKRGTVQTKQLRKVQWSNAILKQQLIEKERIRTLKNSFGQIMLIDGSAISLGENSLAVIESMKENVITKEKNSNIVILEGDVSSTLTALSKRNTINVNVPGIKTDIRSTSFWTSRDKNKIVRVANYNGEIDLESSGTSVTIGENEGSKIIPGQVPSKPKQLLESPKELFPKSKSVFSKNKIELSWSKVSAAVAYQLQISNDKNFSKIITNQTMLKNDYTFTVKKKGSTYWRVASIDKDQLRGKYSNTSNFLYSKNNKKAYLRVDPFKSRKTSSNKILISGQSLAKHLVKVDGTKVELDENGSFSKIIKLKKGLNKIRIDASNNSGQTNSISREIFYEAKIKSNFFNSSQSIYQRVPSILIEIDLEANEKLYLNSELLAENSNFKQLIQLQSSTNEFKLVREDASSFSRSVILDNEAPSIRYNYIPSIISDEKEINISLNEFSSIFINNEERTKAQSYHFRPRYKLGKNQFNIKAIDRAKNVSYTTISVFYDNIAPKYISYKTRKTKDYFKLSIYAKDQGIGLSKSCIVKYKINNSIYFISAKLATNGEYIAQIKRTSSNDKLSIKEIILQDKALNETRIELEK